jgi:hypothetical protein
VNNDFLKWAALAAALVATASAEYELARAVGFNEWVAAAVPGALDIYTVRAMRAHKDVLAAVVAMILVNAASHLVTAGLLPVNVPLVVAVSAIAPLVLWRVHALRVDEGAHSARTPAEYAEGYEVARTPVEPEAYPALPEPVPAVPEAVPADVETEAPRNEIRNETPAPVLAAEEPRTRSEVRVGDVPDWTVSGTYVDEAEGTPQAELDEAALLFKDELLAGKIPGIARIKSECRVGQDKAKQIQDGLRQAQVAWSLAGQGVSS